MAAKNLSYSNSGSNYGHRYVAMVDILGFKRLVKTTSVHDIVGRIDGLLRYIQSAAVLMGASVVSKNKSSDKNIGLFKFNEMHFSDTIFLWTNIIKEPDARRANVEGGVFISLIARLVSRAFLADIPLRVGIGFGECYIDPQRKIFVGNPIVDAHEVESIQEWIGGALHPNVPTPIVAGTGAIIDYKIPVKVQSKTHLTKALKWPDFTDSPHEDVATIKKINSMFDKKLPSDAKGKIENTKVFVHEMLEGLRFAAGENLYLEIKGEELISINEERYLERKPPNKANSADAKKPRG